MKALLTLKKEHQKDERQKKQEQQKKRAMGASGAAFLALGLIGIAVFGYLIFQGGGFSSLTGMADGIGLIVSLVVLLAGIYMK